MLSASKPEWNEDQEIMFILNIGFQTSERFSQSAIQMIPYHKLKYLMKKDNSPRIKAEAIHKRIRKNIRLYRL